MFLIFVGNRERGFFCEETAKHHELDVQYIDADLHISSQAELILQYKEETTAIIYDLEQYADEAEDIVKWILRIQEAMGIKSIIYAAGFSSGSTLIQLLYQGGIKNYIFSIYLGDQKEDLELCLNEYYENFGYEEKRGITFEVQNAEDNTPENGKAITKCIGVAGAIARMGTTTQALQLIKFLQYSGYKAAYFEMNTHRFVESLLEAYEDANVEDEIGRVSYMKVDMYYRADRLQEVLKQGYDYLVFDYGVYSENGFNKISFLEKELQIFVVGSKPGGEFESTYDVLKNNFYNHVQYVFNFVAKSEQKDVLELMEEKASVAYFAEDAKDPFAFSGDGSFWKDMLQVEQKDEKTRKKYRFFGRRKKT